jgi:hypothetical protein
MRPGGAPVRSIHKDIHTIGGQGRAAFRGTDAAGAANRPSMAPRAAHLHNLSMRWTWRPRGNGRRRGRTPASGWSTPLDTQHPCGLATIHRAPPTGISTIAVDKPSASRPPGFGYPTPHTPVGNCRDSRPAASRRPQARRGDRRRRIGPRLPRRGARGSAGVADVHRPTRRGRAGQADFVRPPAPGQASGADGRRALGNRSRPTSRRAKCRHATFASTTKLRA